MGSYMSSQEAGSQIQYPKSSKEVTKEWLQQVLQQYHQKTNPTSQLTVKSFHFNAATSVGNNFNGVVKRMECTYQADDDNIDNKQTFVFKFFANNPMNKLITIKHKQTVKEHQIYSSIIKEFHEFQNKYYRLEYHIGVPELIYGVADDYNFFLMMEDLCALGFEVNPKEEGLSFERARIAVQQLATLHALSYSFNKKTNFLEKYPTFKMNPNYFLFLELSYEAMAENVIKLLECTPGHEHLKEKLQLFLSKPNNISSLWNDLESAKVQCLVHGDYWNNNMLFNKDLSKSHFQPNVIRLIDWQMTYWGNPMHDLQYLIYSSLTKEVRDRELEALLISYYTIFDAITSKHQCKVPDWSFSQFIEEFEKWNVAGFLFGNMIRQFSLSKHIADDEKFNPEYNHGYVAYFASNIMAHYLEHPFTISLLRKAIRRHYSNISEELQSGKNEHLNARILELVVEMNERKLFDDCSKD